MARRATQTGGLRVILEVGEVCLVPESAAITVQDLLKEAVRMAGISARSLPCFCIGIKQVGQPIQWLYGSQPVDATVRAAAKANTLGLHLRFLPSDVEAFVDLDPVAAAYYQKQLHKALMSEELQIASLQTIAQLACLEMVDYLIKDIRRQRKNIAKTSAPKILKYLDQQIGFQIFVPRSAFSGTNKGSLRSLIVEFFPKAWDLHTEDNVVAAYITTCSGQPNFGTELYQGIATSAESLAMGASKGTVMVVPGRSVSFRPERSPNTIELVQLADVRKLCLTGSRVELQKPSSSDYLTFGSLGEARNMATAVDGYRKIGADSAVSMVYETPRERVHAAYGKISRYEAEDALKRMGALDGLYLVRESVSDPLAFGLSVCISGEVSHYKISKHKSGKYGIQDGLRYHALHDLISHYYEEADGLATTLKQNVLELDNVTDLPRAPAIDDSGYMDDAPPRPAKPGRTASSRKLSDIEIPPSQLQIGEELGHGEFGTVHRGIWSQPGRRGVTVALKVLKAGGSVDQTKEFLREANTMVKFDHKYVVKLLGVCTHQPMKLVCELVALGALRSYLRRERNNLDLKQLLVFIYQIAEGMEYLESVHFVHRDLAARNILVATPSHVKISDFGLSRSLTNEKDYYTSERKGKWPIKWYAPECIYYSKFTHKSDVWSFGITAWEILVYGKKPYKGFTGRQVVQFLEDGGRLPKPGDYCPDELNALLQECWLKDQDTRPNFEKLRKSVLQIQANMDRREQDKITADDIYSDAIESQKFFDIEQTEEEVAAEDAEERQQLDATSVAKTIRASPAHIPIEYLSFGAKIGDGHYGPIMEGVLSKPDGTQQQVALKRMKPPKGGKQRQHFWVEAGIMASLAHDNVTRLFGVVPSPEGDMLVCEFAALGAMNAYLQSRKVEQGQVVRFCTQIASGMAYMVQQRFIHRDLAARNVLVKTPAQCKIADFGLSRALGFDSDYYRSQQKGRWPIKWYAPECLLQSKFTHQSDVWSFGVTMWEMFSHGEKPFKGLKGRQVLQLLSKGQRLQPPRNTPAWAVDIMSRCWKEEPKARPTFDEMYNTLVRQR